MKIGVAGTGSIGRRHISNLQKLDPSAQVVLLRPEAQHDQFSNDKGLTVVAYEDINNSSLDGLIIATPSAMHYPLIVQALECGLACYIEKPLITNRDQLQKLSAFIETQDTLPPTQSGCNLRYLPSLIKMRQLIKDGAVGTVLRASFEAGQWLPDWRPSADYTQSYSASKELGGGVTLDLIHELDMARWLIDEFESVNAQAGTSSVLDIETESVMIAVMLSNERVPVSVSLDYISKPPVRRYQVVGDRGSLVWDLHKMILEYRSNEDVESFCSPDDFDVSQTYVSPMQDFLKCIKDKTSAEQDILEGMKSCELALNLKASAGI